MSDARGSRGRRRADVRRGDRLRLSIRPRGNATAWLFGSPPTPPRPSGGSNSAPPGSPPQSPAAGCWTRTTTRGSRRESTHPGSGSRCRTRSARLRPPSGRSWSSSTSTSSPRATRRAFSASIRLRPACDSRADVVGCARRSRSRHPMPSRHKEVDDERHRKRFHRRLRAAPARGARAARRSAELRRPAHFATGGCRGRASRSPSSSWRWWWARRRRRSGPGG
jgi:hypothetical protein